VDGDASLGVGLLLEGIVVEEHDEAVMHLILWIIKFY